MSKSQITNTVLMIRPAAFCYNELGANSNFFQKNNTLASESVSKAKEEFDALTQKLQSVGINVIVVNDTDDTKTSDSVFVNNWISFHENGDVALYPLCATNRKNERREDVLDILEEEGFVVNEIMDYSTAEEDGFFLEGNSSMVLDRVNEKAYCALSPRSDEELFIEFCEDFEYSPVLFEAFHTVDGQRKLVAHTNNMMSIGDTFALICADSIDDKKERKMVLDSLRGDGKEIILLTETQMEHFAANCIELMGKDERRYLVMSTAAHQSLSKKQIAQLEEHLSLLISPLTTIETNGGCGINSSIAGVFLPKSA